VRCGSCAPTQHHSLTLQGIGRSFFIRDNTKRVRPVPCAPPNRSKFSRIMSARCAPPALATLKTPFLDNSLSRALEAVLLTSNALFARVRGVFF